MRRAAILALVAGAAGGAAVLLGAFGWMAWEDYRIRAVYRRRLNGAGAVA